jgi:hypothetical protein
MALTLEQLQAKRDEIIQALEIARIQFTDRSLDYVADKRRSLELIDAEIAKLQAPQNKVFTISTSRGL